MNAKKSKFRTDDESPYDEDFETALQEEEADAEVSISIERLDKDLKRAAKTLSKREARFLVDSYYMIQANRLRAHNQVRAMTEPEDPTKTPPEPAELLKWLTVQSKILESQLRGALDIYSDNQAIGKWARQVIGIGPVIAAGLIAHVDIEKAVTSSDIWSFAGLNPDAVWNKGEIRPWNASLKVLCWKIGRSFVLHGSNPKSVYGGIYRDRKEYEILRNDHGGNKDTAERILNSRRWRSSTVIKTLRSGKLPKGQIDARARRVAVKVFLSHFHAKWRGLEGLSVPVPYSFREESNAHVHFIRPEVP